MHNTRVYSVRNNTENCMRATWGQGYKLHMKKQTDMMMYVAQASESRLIGAW